MHGTSALPRRTPKGVKARWSLWALSTAVNPGRRCTTTVNFNPCCFLLADPDHFGIDVIPLIFRDSSVAELLACTPETVRQSYLLPLLYDGRIPMIRPEVPNDPEQAYRAVGGDE